MWGMSDVGQSDAKNMSRMCLVLYASVMTFMLAWNALVFTSPKNSSSSERATSGDVLLIEFTQHAKAQTVSEIRRLFDDSKSVDHTEVTKGKDVLKKMADALDLSGELNEPWMLSVTPGDVLEVVFAVDTKGLYTMKSVVERLKRNPMVESVDTSREVLPLLPASSDSHKSRARRNKVLALFCLLFSSACWPLIATTFLGKEEKIQMELNRRFVVYGGVAGFFGFFLSVALSLSLRGTAPYAGFFASAVSLIGMMGVGAILGWVGAKIVNHVH